MLKKRKQKKVQQRDERRLATADEFTAALKKAEQREDPAVRIIELYKLNYSIRAHINGLPKEAYAKEDNIYAGTAMTTMMGSISAPFLLAAGVAPVIGVPLFIGGVAAAGALAGVASVRKRAVTKKINKEAAGHVDKLKELQNRIAEITDKTIENNMKGIIKSPSYEDAKKMPGISDKFLAAAAHHIMGADETHVAAEKKEPVLKKRVKPQI